MVKSLYNLIAMDSNSFSERFFFFNFKNEVQEGKVETSQINPLIKPLWIVHFLF